MTARGSHPPHGCILTLTPEERQTLRRALQARALTLLEAFGPEDPVTQAEVSRIVGLLERLD